MYLRSCLILLAAGSVGIQALAISKATGRQDFGVGFSLSIDYAVASIYYPDGSTVDLIKTQGSPEYRNLMKRAGRDSLSLRPQNSKSTSSRSLTHTIEDDQVLLEDRLSQWFNVKHKETGMVEMFQTLKVAAESYLQRSIETVDVAIPFPMSPGLEASIASAYRMSSLHYAQSPQLAGVVATRYEGLVGSCSDDDTSHSDPAQLLVAVDWNRAAFTLTILEEECGTVNWRRVEHSEKLGDEATRTCRAQHDEETCDAELKDFIRSALKPLRDEHAPSFIQTMLLVGEYSMSTKIMWLVKEQLKDQYPATLASNPTNKFRQHVQPVDPVFAAARAAAWNSWSLMSLSRGYEADDNFDLAIEL